MKAFKYNVGEYKPHQCHARLDAGGHTAGWDRYAPHPFKTNSLSDHGALKSLISDQSL